MSGKMRSGFFSSSPNSRRSVTAIAGGTSILCFGLLAPVLLGTAGCGGGGNTVTLPGNGAAVNLGRAAVLIGTYSSTQTLANGKTEETTIEFIPGGGNETLSGSYTKRILSVRPGGGTDYVDFSAGTLTGTILANGNLQVIFTPDDDIQSQISGKATRAAGSTQSEYTIGQNGRTLADIITQTLATRIQELVQTYRANSVAGNWSGIPSSTGGFQLSDPRTDTPVGPVTGMSIRYDAPSNSLGNTYTAAVTLTDPTTGTPYTATGAQARLYSQYDGNLPSNFSGITNLSAGDFFVIGKGNLPANAGTLTIPNVPVVGSVSVSLANRAFLFEAGVGSYENDRIQLGTLFIKFETSDPLYALLPFAGINPDATGGYIAVGHFLITNGTTVTPTPTPNNETLPIGTIAFKDASGTNANTTTITQAEASASFQGNILNASLFQESGNVSRVVTLRLGTSGDSSLAVGKTYPIATGSTVATGKALVYYMDQINGGQRCFQADGGSVVVIAHDSQTTTMRVVNATMKPLTSGSTLTPNGTFTMNATGKF